MGRRSAKEPASTQSLILSTSRPLDKLKALRDQGLQRQIESLGGCGSSNSKTSLGASQQPRTRKRSGSLISSCRQRTVRKLVDADFLDRRFGSYDIEEHRHVIPTGAPPDITSLQSVFLLSQAAKMVASSQPSAPTRESSWDDGLSEPTLNNVDEDGTADLDPDQDYESDASVVSTTTTMDESVKNFFYENGRRYHRFREGLYPFPNDTIEQEREELLHVLIKSLAGGKLHQAPIGSHPQNILDVGTGTGAWVVESEYSCP